MDFAAECQTLLNPVPRIRQVAAVQRDPAKRTLRVGRAGPITSLLAYRQHGREVRLRAIELATGGSRPAGDAERVGTDVAGHRRCILQATHRQRRLQPRETLAETDERV